MSLIHNILSKRETYLGVGLLLLSSCFQQSAAQQAPSAPNPYESSYYRPTPKPPEAAAMARYGEVPVSTNTGVPDISIPIYTLNTRSLSVPVSISYHAGGIKVNDIASVVGLGWNLNAGGMISHSPSGKRDPIGGPFPRQYPRDATDYRIELNSSVNYYQGIAEPDYVFANNVVNGQYDTDPDVFTGSFLSRSVKFVIDDSGKACTLPFQPLDFELSPQTIVVIDEAGTRYTFERTEENQPIAQSIQGICDPGNADNAKSGFTYFLTLIKSIDNDSVRFEYELYGSNGIIQYFNNYQQNQYFRNTLAEHAQCSLGDPKFPNTTCLRGLKVLNASRLKRIVSTFGTTVEFNYSATTRLDLPGSNALESVFVKEGNVVIRRFAFSYFYASNRLFLSSFQELGKKPHFFSYFPGIPTILSFSQDHWGYYNAKNNITLLPKTAFHSPSLGLINIGSADRSPNPSAMTAGTLRRITYPTGGFTEFEFETNQIWGAPILTARSACVAYDSTIVIATPDYVGMTPQDSIRIKVTPFQVASYNPSFQEYALKYDIGWHGGVTNGTDPYLKIERIESSGARTTILHIGSGVSAPTGYWLQSLAAGSYEITVLGTYTRLANASLLYKYKTCENGSTTKNQYVGGLRIKTIKDYHDPSRPPVVRTYKYTQFSDTTKSSATYQGEISYANFTHYLSVYTNPSLCPGGGPSPTERYSCDFIVISSSIQFLSNSNANSPITYSSVVEFFDLSGSQGKIEYSYSGIDDIHNYIGDWSFIPVTSYEFSRSILTKKKSYAFKSATLSYLPLEEVSYSHTRYHSLNDQSLCLSNTFQPFCQGITEINSEFKNFNEKIVLGLQIKQNHVEMPASSCAIGQLAQFTPLYYRFLSVWAPLTYMQIKEYDPVDSTKAQVRQFFYDYANPKHAQITQVKSIDNSRDTSIVWIKYPYDYSWSGSLSPWDGAAKSIKLFREMKVKSTPIERVVGLKKFGGSPVVLGGLLNLYQPFSTFSVNEEYIFPALSKVETFKPTQTLGFASFSFSNISSNAFFRHNGYSLENEVIARTLRGQWTEMRGRDGNITSRIWGYNERLPIAEAVNTPLVNIAYTSFEPNDKGKFTFSGQNSLDSYSGVQSYRVQSGPINATVAAPGNYVLSFWAKGTGSVNVNSGLWTQALSNNWRLYSRQLNSISSVTITSASSDVLIDELKLFPTSSTLNAFTYQPESGVTSISDPSGRTSLYEYDNLGRLSTVKDLNKQIQTINQYQYGTSFSAIPFFMNGSQASYTQVIGMPISFVADDLQPINDQPFTYSWNFGNGYSTEGRLVSYTYPATGSYTVQLTVSHPHQQTVIQTGQVMVVNCPSLANTFFLTPSHPSVQDQVVINANPSGGCPPFAYQWQWRQIGTTNWTPLSGTTNSQTFLPVLPCQGFEVKCKVSNTNGTFSEFTQSVAPLVNCLAQSLQLVHTPNPFYIADGVTCSMNVTDACQPLLYQWYGKSVNESSWTYLSASQAIQLFPPMPLEGYQVKCIVTGGISGQTQEFQRTLDPVDGCPGCQY